MSEKVERALEGRLLPPSPEVSSGRIPTSPDPAQAASEEISRLGDDLARVARTTAQDVADTRQLIQSSVQEGAH